MHQNEGIGVGLSTADSLVRALGGKLNVNSYDQDQDFKNVVEFKVRTTEKGLEESFNDDLQKFKERKRNQKIVELQLNEDEPPLNDENKKSFSSFDVLSYSSSFDVKPVNFPNVKKSLLGEKLLK